MITGNNILNFSKYGAMYFFEFAVAESINLFSINSGEALATLVVVIVEVNLMLYLLNISMNSKRLLLK